MTLQLCVTHTILATHTTHIDDVSRRGLLIGAFTAAIFASCGDDGDEAPPQDPVTRNLEDLFGPVTVPTRPQRLIAAEDVTLNNLLALGVKPVGGFIFADSLIRHTKHLMSPDYVDLRKDGQLDLEKALTLQPDMIVSLGGSRSNPRLAEACTAYKRAVPTFCYEYDFVYEEQIKNNILELAKAINLEEKAHKVIAAYDARVAGMKRNVTAAGFDDKPVSVIRVFNANEYAIRVGTLESIAFRAIGIPQPEGQRNPLDQQIRFSAENLSILNQSYALVIYADDDDVRGGRSSVTETMIQTQPLWQALTPVREGRLVFLPAWNGADMPKLMTILDEIEQYVLPLAR